MVMLPIRQNTSTPLKVVKPRTVALNDITQSSSQPQHKPVMSSDTIQPSSQPQLKPATNDNKTTIFSISTLASYI